MLRGAHYGLTKNILGYVSLPLGSLRTILAGHDQGSARSSFPFIWGSVMASLHPWRR